MPLTVNQTPTISSECQQPTSKLMTVKLIINKIMQSASHPLTTYNTHQFYLDIWEHQGVLLERKRLFNMMDNSIKKFLMQLPVTAKKAHFISHTNKALVLTLSLGYGISKKLSSIMANERARREIEQLNSLNTIEKIHRLKSWD